MEDHSCGICNNRPRAVRNLPCGHGGVCERCTIELVLRAVPSGLNCIYCRCTVSRLMVAPVTMATAGAGQVLPRRMPTNLAVPEPEGHIFESVQAFVLAMLDHADAEVANAARTALARKQEEQEGRTELMDAAEEGSAETVMALLAAPGIDVNAADRDGRTALMWAADKGRTQMVRTLLAAPGLDVNAADGAGRTALALAKARRHFRIAYLLRAAGSIEENDNTCCIIN